MLLGDGCWALSDVFLVFVGRIFNDSQVSTEARVHLLRSLAYAALKDDIILLLHQDRRDHVLMNYLMDIEKLKPEEQEAVALFVGFFFHFFTRSWLTISFSSRLAICSKTPTHLNGFSILANGLSTVNRHQTSEPPQKLWFTRCCQAAQSFKNSALLCHTTLESRK